MAGEGAETPQRSLWLEVSVVLAVVIPYPLYTSITSLGTPLGESTANDLSFFLLFNGLAWAALGLYVMGRSGQSWETFGLHRPFRIVDLVTVLVLGGFLAQAVHPLLYEVTAWLLGEGVFESPIFSAEFADPIPVGLAATTLFFAGHLMNALAEEVVFRAYLITRLRQLLGSTALAITVSGALFASYHVYQGVYGLISAFASAVVYGCAFVWLGRVWPLVLLHWLLNCNRALTPEGIVPLFLLLFLGLPVICAVRAVLRRTAS